MVKMINFISVRKRRAGLGYNALFGRGEFEVSERYLGEMPRRELQHSTQEKGLRWNYPHTEPQRSHFSVKMLFFWPILGTRLMVLSVPTETKVRLHFTVITSLLLI